MRIPYLIQPKIIWAFVSQGFVALLSVIFAKIVAVYIAPDVFGAYNLQFALLAFGNSLLISPIIQSFKANWAENKAEEELDFHIGIIIGVHLFTIALVLLSVLFVYNDTWILLIFLSIFWLCQSIYTLGRDFFNINDNQKNYALLALSTAFILIIALIGFVYIGFQQIWAIWLAQLLSFALPMIFIIAFFKKREMLSSFKFSLVLKSIIRYQHKISSLLIYAIPLMLLALFSWFSNYADKYLINYFLQKQDVGVYSAVYGLASKLILTLNSPFILLLNPIVLSYKNAGTPHQSINAKIFKYVTIYFCIGLLLTIILYFLSQPLGLLFLSENYKYGFKLIPYLALAYLFLTMVHLLETKFYAYGFTKYILYHNIFAAFVNIVLNIILIPKMGILGSAVSMIFTTFSQLVFCLFLIKKA